MEDVTQQLVGKTVERVERYKDCYDEYSGFMMYFTDGTTLDVSSKSYNDGSSLCLVEVS